MTPELWRLAFLWVAWCALHSLLIARGAQRALRSALGPRFRFVRLAFNGVALATFVPIYAYSLTLRGPVLFDWWGAWIPVGVPLLLAALTLFWAGGRSYDMRVFLGIGEKGRSGMAGEGALSRRGILGAIRHPWYTAGLCILWVRPKDAAGLVTAILLSAYLVVGAHLEEAKLIAEFGDGYRAYRREVSMFLPLRWLRGLLSRAG